MRRLFIGCGRTSTIYYNPLPVGGTAIETYDVHSDMPHRPMPHNSNPPALGDGDGDVTMDIDPFMHPDFIGSIIDYGNALLQHGSCAASFDEVYFEYIPKDVFGSAVNCNIAFRHAANVLKAGGSLFLRTAADISMGSQVRLSLAASGLTSIKFMPDGRTLVATNGVGPNWKYSTKYQAKGNW